MITYKRYWNKFNTVKSAAKKAYYYVKFDEFKSNLWTRFEGINRNRYKQCISEKFNECTVEEDVITDPNEIATKFNEYFVYVRPNLAAKIPANSQT